MSMFYMSSAVGVESILVSVLSMLSDPNFESPANIEASVSQRMSGHGMACDVM